MHIAVDLDDTAFDSLPALLLFYNRKHGTNFKKKDFFSCLYRDVWGVTEKEEQNELEEFYQSKYYDKIVPMEGAVEALSLLVKYGFILSAITGRKYSLAEKTEKSVKEHFSNIFSNIYLTNSYGLEGVRIKKSVICKMNHVELFVEDDPCHIEDCVNFNIPVLVYGNPWNIIPIDGSIRLKNWNQILKVVRILLSV